MHVLFQGGAAGWVTEGQMREAAEDYMGEYQQTIGSEPACVDDGTTGHRGR